MILKIVYPRTCAIHIVLKTNDIAKNTIFIAGETGIKTAINALAGILYDASAIPKAVNHKTISMRGRMSCNC